MSVEDEENRTYSVMVRLRRTTHEDAYVAVPLTESVMGAKEDGSFGLDPEALLAEAARLGRDARVQWAVESGEIEPHPMQGPMPEDRQCFDAVVDAKGS